MKAILDFSAIKEANRAEAKLNILAYMPNNRTIDDPDWVDPGDGSLPDQIPEFTDIEWLNEKNWEFWMKVNARGHKIRVARAAEQAINIREE